MKNNEFNKDFYIHFFVILFSVIITNNTIFIMISWEFMIDLDKKMSFYIFFVPLFLLILFYSIFIIYILRTIKKNRRKTLRLEKVSPYYFFKRIAIIIMGAFIVNDFFLLFKFRKFFLLAYNEGTRKIYLLNSDNISYRDKLIREIELLKSKYIFYIVVVFIISILSHFIFSLISARLMIKYYYRNNRNNKFNKRHN